MNSPLASTPSIASRMPGKSGSYWSFTSTSGIGRTIRKSRASALEDQIGRQCDNCDDHRVLDETEVVVEVLVAPSGAPADAGEGKGPDCRADGRQQDIAPEGHSEDAGRNRDERPDDRGHPADQHRQVVPAVEPALRPIELVARKVKPASTPFEPRPPPAQADGPSDNRSDHVPDRPGQGHHDEGPGMRGDARPEQVDVLAGERARGQGSRVDHDELARRWKDSVDRHQQEDGVDAVITDQRRERARDAGDRHRGRGYTRRRKGAVSSTEPASLTAVTLKR